MKQSKEYWKEQSKCFDTAAFYYDVYRPGYPNEMIDDLIQLTGINIHSNLLEVGAGSGKATEQFVSRGYHVTCIEPGQQLMEVGIQKFNENQVTYHNYRFEEWSEQKNFFDLVYSAQAFHWVPKPEGYNKCYETLKDNGYLALFWNFYVETGSEIEQDIKELFQNYPIGYLDNEEQLEKRINQTVQEMQESHKFQEIEVRRYPWSIEQDAAEYIGFIKTTNFLSLSEEDQTKVLRRIVEIFQKHGGRLTRKFVCTLFTGKKVK